MKGLCTKLRCMKIKHSSVNIRTGVVTPGKSEWVIQECGIPLFGDAERARGICDSCHSGWTHPDNRPIGAVTGPNTPNYCSKCTPAGLGYCRCEIACNE